MVSSINSAVATEILRESSDFKTKALKKEEDKLKKYQDEVNIGNKRISDLGQFKTFLEDLSYQVTDFTFNPLSKSNVFDAKKAIAPKKLSENYANIKVKSGASNQNIPFQIIRMAKGEILQSTKVFNPKDKMSDIVSEIADKKVTFTVLDNGMKSQNFDDKDANVVGTGDNQFKVGEFSIGNSMKIKIEEKDTLGKIVDKINDITKTYGEANNPHVVAEVIKNKEGKYFIWIKSDAKHHGVQNKFEITGDNSGKFTEYRETIDVSFNDDTTVERFVADLKHNAKKADIEVVYNPDKTEGGNILLKSLLTGEGNEIVVDKNLEKIIGTSNKILGAKDAKIKVNGLEITSKTNNIETDSLKIDLFGEPKDSELTEEFNLKIADDTEGLYEKLESLAKSYNNLSLFVAQHSLKVHDENVYSKPAIKATLSVHKDILSSLNDQLFNYFSQFNQAGGYVAENQISDLGIGIISKEITPPSENVGEVEQNYMPVQYYEIVIDKSKLQKAIEEKFDTFKEVLSTQFNSTNNDFSLNNNHKDVSFEVQGIKSLEYNVDYNKIKYMTNISNENTANAKINDSLSDKHYFLINDVRIPVDKNTTYTSLVDEINKHASATKIRADLLDSSNKIISTKNLEANQKVKIALSSYYRTKEERQKIEKGQTNLQKQDNLRDKLVLVDVNNVLSGIFNSDESKDLDDKTENEILGDRIPQIRFFDTSSVIKVEANLRNYEKAGIPAYLQLADSKKYEEGGIIKILPKLDTSKSSKYIDLQNFEVSYDAKFNGNSTIIAKQGMADKINNTLMSYIDSNRIIDGLIQHEISEKQYKESNLSFEKEAFKYRKARIERDFAMIKAAEMKLATQQAYLKQMSNDNHNS